MFSRYVAVVVVGLAVGSAGQIVEAGNLAGTAFYSNEVETDFVTNEEIRSETLIVVSNESDDVGLIIDFSDGYWAVANQEPLNDWFRDLMMEKEATVLYRGNDMKKAVTVELLKTNVSPGVALNSMNLSHARQILKSQKVGMKICGKNYTFDLTHPDVAKGRGAMNRVFGQR